MNSLTFVPSISISSSPCGSVTQTSFTQPFSFSCTPRQPTLHPHPASPSSARSHIHMVTVSRPSFKSTSFDDSDNDPTIAPFPEEQNSLPTVPEVIAVSGTICEFMNRERVRDIANYVVRFGRKFVKMTALDAAGFTADIVSCDESSCVCVQERFDWPLGLCMNAGDVINALKHLSMACGLPADF